jgi:hypothetical protein
MNESLVLKQFDVNDLGLSDYEDELDLLRVVEDNNDQQHPLSDLNLLQLVEAS